MQLFYPFGNPSESIGIHKYLDNTKNQSYIPITGCVLSHILSCSRLSSLEKMYYILADSLSYINSSKGRNRSVSLPAKSWAERLACSKSEVFVLQKSLEDKGYFIIYRDKNDKGQNNRNTITTTIPDLVFNDLKYEPDRFNLNSEGDIETQGTDHSLSDHIDSIDKTFIPTLEGKRQHLERTKMFIRVSYLFLKQLNSNCNISATSKIVLLYLFTKIYKNSAGKCDYNDAVDGLTNNTCYLYSIVTFTSYQELHTELKLHRNSLTKALKTLEAANLINRDQIVIKSDDDYNSRADKSLWRISLLGVGVGGDNTCQKQQSIDNDQVSDIDEDITRESFADKGCTKYDPPCTNSGQLYNKNFIINKSINRNIDYIDAKSEEKFLENELCSFPSKSYNNPSFLNDSCKETLLRPNEEQAKTTVRSTNKEVLGDGVQQKEQSRVLDSKQKEIPKQKLKEQWQELRHFYPLSEKDIGLLNSKANREFSNNFVNQLLLKLYIKYPEKRFKNKFTFLSYMTQILANEKHQGPLVNHTNFRFSCNIGTEEKNLLEYERYLNQIEDSLNLSKEMQLKKKIAGRFSTEVAYKILKRVEFKVNCDNGFITALIPIILDLSEKQIEILSEQLKAVYGINGYYVAEVKDEEPAKGSRGKREIAREAKKEMIYPKTTKPAIVSNSEDIGILANSIDKDTTNVNTAWHQIRKRLIKELGEDIDMAWFSKVVATQCNDTKTLTLTMPTRFMADWIRNNYSHVIRRLSEGCEVKMVEYEYKQSNKLL